MTARVRGLLEEIDALVRPADEDGAEPSRAADAEAPDNQLAPDDQLAL
jgi:hypothetical protein